VSPENRSEANLKIGDAFNIVFFWCGFLVNGDPKPAVEATRKFAKVYPLAQAKNPPPMKFINVSGRA
jgi:hypothetical protein